MSDEAKVRELLAPFAERPVDLEGREFPVNREAAVAVIMKTAREGARARPYRVGVRGAALATGLALAAAALLFLGRGANEVPLPTAKSALRPMAGTTLAEVSGMVTQRRAGASQRVQPGSHARAIDSNAVLQTAIRSSARLRNAQGDEVAVFENSALALSGFDQPSRGVQLLAGSIRCEVSDLAPGRRFSVLTPNASIEVRGTAFGVIVSGRGAAARTCVKVERGTVLITSSRSEQQLGAGQSWGCEAERPSSNITDAESAAPRDAAVEAPKESTKDRGDGQAVKVGTLDEENRLFQAGLAAERRRDFAAARTAFDQLLTRFPTSPLASDARVARARVQAQQSQAPAP